MNITGLNGINIFKTTLVDSVGKTKFKGSPRV